jgi:hypothetical protein
MFLNVKMRVGVKVYWCILILPFSGNFHGEFSHIRTEKCILQKVAECTGGRHRDRSFSSSQRGGGGVKSILVHSATLHDFPWEFSHKARKVHLIENGQL